jgi:hypothetical protein
MKKNSKLRVEHHEVSVAASKGRDWTAAGLFVLCLVLYLANLRTVPLASGGDTIPNRLIPFALLAHGTPALDAFRPEFERTGVATWYLNEKRGSLVSFYPVGTSFVALPVYVPVYAYLAITGQNSPRVLLAWSEPMEKLAAAILSALAVVFFYLTVRRRMDRRSAFLAALVFGLGSSVWATASQMLWQQTAIVVTLSAALWFLTWPDLPRWACAAAGAALSLAVVARPTAAVLLAAGFFTALLTAGALRERLWRAIALILGSLPLLLIGLGINLYYFKHPAGGYGLLTGFFAAGLFSRERLLGIGGLLVSPNRGLLVFTPIAVLGIWGLARQAVPRRGGDPVLLPFGVAALVHLLVVGSYPVWWGGWSFGPRYLVDILPILGLAAVDTWNRMGTPSRRIAKIAIVCSLLVQVNGAFCFPASHWDPRMADPARAVWSLKDFELLQDFGVWLKAGRWATPY